MKTKKIKKVIFKLAEMCNTTKCEDCFLAYQENKCVLRHASLPDIAKGCFERDHRQPYEGTVWIRFGNKEEYNANIDMVTERLSSSGDYTVNIYLKDTNVKTVLVGMRADNDIFEGLIELFGAENVKLLLNVPEDVIAYF